MFLMPSHWGNVLKTCTLFLFYIWRLSTLKISLPLFWIFPLLCREEKVVTRVLLRVELGEKLVFLYLFPERFPKSLPGLLVCLLPAYIQTGNSGTFCLQRLSVVSLLVERSLILKYAVNPPVGAQQPCTSNTYCSIGTDRSNCVLSLVNQLLLQAAIVLAGGLCPPEPAVYLQALQTWTGLLPVFPLGSELLVLHEWSMKKSNPQAQTVKGQTARLHTLAFCLL